jgi:hypothetical protein
MALLATWLANTDTDLSLGYQRMSEVTKASSNIYINAALDPSPLAF